MENEFQSRNVFFDNQQLEGKSRGKTKLEHSLYTIGIFCPANEKYYFVKSAARGM